MEPHHFTKSQKYVTFILLIVILLIGCITFLSINRLQNQQALKITSQATESFESSTAQVISEINPNTEIIYKSNAENIQSDCRDDLWATYPCVYEIGMHDRGAPACVKSFSTTCNKPYKPTIPKGYEQYCRIVKYSSQFSGVECDLPDNMCVADEPCLKDAIKLAGTMCGCEIQIIPANSKQVQPISIAPTRL